MFPAKTEGANLLEAKINNLALLDAFACKGAEGS